MAVFVNDDKIPYHQRHYDNLRTKISVKGSLPWSLSSNSTLVHCVEPPTGINSASIVPEEHVFEALKNTCGGQDASDQRYQNLSQQLVEAAGFVQIKCNDCLLYNGKVMSSLRIDNSIPAGPDEAVIHAIIKQMNTATIKPMNAAQLDLTINGTMADLLQGSQHPEASK